MGLVLAFLFCPCSLSGCATRVNIMSIFLSSIDEKDGLAVSLKEASRLVEEAKEREVQMQNKLKAMEQQIKVLTERDHEVSFVLAFD